MSPLPLEGTIILDLSRLLPGPLCTLHLADLGAEVIKIEEPGTGDYARGIPPLTKNISTFFLTINRNKKSVTLNLKSEEGRDIMLKLVEKADVVVESFRPGVLEKLGLSYAELEKRNPAIILCSITGYGQSGPYRDKAGHDLNYLAYAGVLRPTPGHHTPAIPNFQIGDIVGGTQNAAIGILAAIISQKTTGKGQHLDISMLDGLLASNVVTKDEKFVALGALEFKFWKSFCESIDREDLVSKHMAMGDEGQEVFNELDAIFASKTRADWILDTEDADCCIAPVNTIEEALRDPQIVHRKLLVKGNHSEEGSVNYFDLPIKSTAIDSNIEQQAPLLGEHNTEVLQGLGYQEEDISKLQESGVI